MEIGVQDGETVAQNTDEWKEVSVVVIGFNVFSKL